MAPKNRLNPQKSSFIASKVAGKFLAQSALAPSASATKFHLAESPLATIFLGFHWISPKIRMLMEFHQHGYGLGI